jgi:4-hydroxy-3-polyprenylbenzoate decarboxylase
MYFTYQNMLMQLFGVFAILVSLPIIIASSLEIELYYRPETLEDSLKLRPYDGTLLGIIDEITMYVSRIHLENMLKLARLGVCILPANPGFYNEPTQVAELVDFIVARILDQLRITHTLAKRWGREA